MPVSFTQRIVESFEARADRIGMRIVGVDGSEHTFREMLRQIRSIAWNLRQNGIQKGDRVALIGENHPNWALAYLAILFAGAVVVPLDPHGEIQTLANFFRDSEAKLVFLDNVQFAQLVDITDILGREIPYVMWYAQRTSRRPSPEELQESAAKLNESIRRRSATAAPSLERMRERQQAIAMREQARWIDEEVERSSFENWTNFTDSSTEFPLAVSASDIAVLMYTSGTTRKPKGVPLTHGNILAELEGVNYILELTDKEKILSLLPLFHAYLQIVNLWIAPVYGCEVGYLKELTPAELSDAMRIFKPTILTTVPRLWYLFHKKIFDAVKAKSRTVQRLFRIMLGFNSILIETTGLNLGPTLFKEVHEGFGGRLRLAISAGSRFDEDVALDLHKLGFTILQGYGLTETSGAATATHIDDNRVGSVGKPMRGAEVKIDSPDKDGVGEVLIKGPMVFSGYYHNPEATNEAFTDDGWFRSGDLGRFDREGHLYIVGRAKDVIVLPSGKNVHPEDIEVHYLKCPLVAELAVIGVADATEKRAGAEKLAAVVVPDFDHLKKEKIANAGEALRHALDNLGRSLPEYQRVRDYVLRAEPLPRTATRKIKRFQLKQEMESGLIGSQPKEPKTWSLSPAEKDLLTTTSGKAVIAAIRKNSPDGDLIHPGMNLEIDLGLDSLARAETFATLEHAFATEFTADEAGEALTVADAIALVNRHGGSETADVSLDLNWGKIFREADDEFPEVRWILRDRPAFAFFAWSVYKAFNIFCRIFMRLEVEGVENLTGAQASRLPKRKTHEPEIAQSVTHENASASETLALQSFLICPNHQSFLDPFVVCSNYPYSLFKRIFHVGASEFFENPIMRWLAKLLNVVPVNPDAELMKAMKAGAIGLKHGKVLNIYPEGERAFDGELHAFKKGAAILATELDLPIVPVALDGLYKVWPRRSMRIRPAKVKIKIGEPFYARDVIAAAADHQQQAHAVQDRSLTATSVAYARDIANVDDRYDVVIRHLRDTIAAMVSDLRSK